MSAYYRRYLHLPLILVALLIASFGIIALFDALRSRVEPISWPNSLQRSDETENLKEPLLNTVTIQNGRVIARNGQPVTLGATESARIIQDLRATAPLSAEQSPTSWLGLDTWPEKLGEASIGLVLLWIGLVCFRQSYRARYAADFGEWGHHAISGNPLLAIENSQLRLLRPYPFAASLLAHRDFVAADELTEIHPGGGSAVLAGREVLYFTYGQREEVKAFAGRNQIPLVNRVDAWQFLMIPFDSEYDADEQAAVEEQLLSTLVHLGISIEEIKRIRRTLRRWHRFLPWNWASIAEETTPNQLDMLYLTGAGLLPRRRWYWYTMEIALRGAPTSHP